MRKGDRVTLYLPMVPEAAVAMLACARIGAVHSIVFAGFSPEALGSRIEDCDNDVVITADEGLRGGKRIPLKANVDAALEHHGKVRRVIVLRHTGADVPMVEGRDIDWAEAVAGQPAECAPQEMGAEDPLFILYTSGSTGKPKGVLHTTGGYRGMGGDDPRIHLRLPPARRRPHAGLLVRGRHRLGHRAQLRGLRPAR